MDWQRGSRPNHGFHRPMGNNFVPPPQYAGGFRGNFNGPRHRHEMTSPSFNFMNRIAAQGEFRHPKPYHSDYNAPFQRQGFSSPSRSRHPYKQELTSYPLNPGMMSVGFHNHNVHNMSRNNKHLGYQRPKGEKSNAKFDIRKYFKESMLQDPWEALIQKGNPQEKTTGMVS